MKKTTLKTRLWALAATLLLLVSLLAMPVSAENVAAQGNDTFSFNKYLVFDKNANVPNVTFTFTIAAGDAVEATDDNGNRAIYSGTDATRTNQRLPVLKVDADDNVQSVNVTFAPGDTASAATGKPGDNSAADYKYATKSVTVDFTGVTYNTPGIYRYKIMETASTAPGITDDSELERTLDVYVQYKTGSEVELEVAGYALYEGVPSIDADYAEKGNAGQAATDTKSDGYVNEYTTYDLTLKKEVKGNQGDRDKYFAFTVNITGAVAGTVYTVDLPETENHEDNSTDPLTVGVGGSVSATYYLKHGQSIVIQGLTADTHYTITEDDYSSDGYSTAYSVEVGGEKVVQSTTSNSTGDRKMSIDATEPEGTATTDDNTVTFTNTKNGTVPTGILLETAPYLILGAVVVVGLVVLFATRRRRTRE